MLNLNSRMLACAAALTMASQLSARAAEPTVLVDDLENPSGVAVHSGGDVFVSERRGVVRLHPGADGKMTRAYEVSKYPTDIYGKGPMYDIGPLGVAFLDDGHLIVSDGSRVDGDELVRVYKIGAEAPKEPQSEDSAAYTLGPIKAGTDSAKGEGNFYAIAIANDTAFITSNGDDTKGWIVGFPIVDGKPGELQAMIATKPLLEVDAPVGITTSSKGHLVVGQMGEVNVPGDSLLTIYDPATKELKEKYATGLNDIAALAYSPTTGKLYAADFSWVEPAKGALYELVVVGDKCEPKKVADLDKPTALAFDKDGNLLVTVFGTAKDGETKKAGKVLKFAKGL